MAHSASPLKIVSNQSNIGPAPDANRRSIGRVLLTKGWVTEGELLKAWHIQRSEAAPIGEILVGLGKISTDQLFWALGTLHRLDVVDFQAFPPSMNWTDFTDAQTSLKHGYIVWRNRPNSLTFAVTDPNKITEVTEKFQTADTYVDFVLVKPACLQNYIAACKSIDLQKNALGYCPKSMSCKSWAHWNKSNLWGVALSGSLILATYIAPLTVLSTILGIICVALTLLMCFRILCLFTPPPQADMPSDSADPHKVTKRPKVSILVPLYKESAILKRLSDRLQALAYPVELLEICFIYEETDLETKATLKALDLPWHMKIVEAPCDRLQTKPRAMNYALGFCSGSIIGIYDAEDAPEINQIEQVVQKFAKSGESVACIQCVLDFYNAGTNWMSRCFTIEYAILFRLILPALDRLKLPIPLGGTSVFFRRDILEKLGCWDAYNVTEDADLGYRLYRMGYRCSWINAVTYEEANYRMVPWVKQRSRWLKGFLLTALVHLKNPLILQRQVGTVAVLSMLTLTVVPWILCPLVPVILPMWALSIGLDLPLYSELPSWFITTLVGIFLATETLSLILAFKVTNSDQHKHLRPWIITTIIYWPISCLASYKALFEFFVRPAYWDKSEHGLNDKLFVKEIEVLTKNTGQYPESHSVRAG